jgi:hypothetical protein
MKKLIFFSLLFCFALSSFACGISVDVSGTCKDFDVTVSADVDGCYDVKIDTDAEVLHNDGWKSGFFYVKDALCSSDNYTTLKIRMNTRGNVTAIAKLRQNNTLIAEEFSINQNCPLLVSNEEMFLIVVLVIITAVSGIFWYERT